MPHKDMSYYRRTVSLKTAAELIGLIEKLGFLKKYKKSQADYFQGLWLEGNFGKKIFSKEYIAYSYFKNPDELSPHLVFENGIAVGRKDFRPEFPNPLFACYFGLVSYNYFLKTSSKKSIDSFFKQVSFLEKYGEEKTNGFWLPYHQPNPKHNLAPPWYAGITQALAASVFLRAWLESEIDMYKNRAIELIQTLSIPIEENGFFRLTVDGFPWIEEYPSAKPSFVLNGFLFCLIAVLEIEYIWGKILPKTLKIESLSKSVFYNLHHFIYGKYTRYRKTSKQFSNIEYQGLYVFIFLHLYKLTGRSAWLKLSCHFNQNTNWKAFYKFYGIEAGEERIAKYYESCHTIEK